MTRIVQFITNHRSYVSGDVAGFPEDKANTLIEAGAARAYDPGNPDDGPVPPPPEKVQTQSVNRMAGRQGAALKPVTKADSAVQAGGSWRSKSDD
jgi:hypothetical protein